MARRRLDTILTERGLFASCTQAARSVMAGEVLLGEGRRVAAKPSEMVDEDVLVQVREAPPYVSRGGVKLANALRESGLAVEGRRALDVGASTGGFTDCLLAHGAAAVVALDVAYGQLDWRLRSDPRVHVIERVNARALRPETLPYRPDLAVVDVSFISLAKVLPAVIGCLAERHDVLAMVKPQFEVGRARVGKGGVVRDPAHRRAALVEVGRAAVAMGERVRGFYSSGLPGPKGNRETFVWLAAGSGGGERGDVEALARRVEP